MATKPRPPVEQDASMKAHKTQLFEADEPVDVGSGRPFRQFLIETPAEPLPLWVKAALWAAGVIVGLLLILALWRISQPRTPKAPGADLGRPAAVLDC